MINRLHPKLVFSFHTYSLFAYLINRSMVSSLNPMCHISLIVDALICNCMHLCVPHYLHTSLQVVVVSMIHALSSHSNMTTCVKRQAIIRIMIPIRLLNRGGRHLMLRRWRTQPITTDTVCVRYLESLRAAKSLSQYALRIISSSRKISGMVGGDLNGMSPLAMVVVTVKLRDSWKFRLVSWYFNSHKV